MALSCVVPAMQLSVSGWLDEREMPRRRRVTAHSGFLLTADVVNAGDAGRFITTKPDRSRCCTSRRAAICAANLRHHGCACAPPSGGRACRLSDRRGMRKRPKEADRLGNLPRKPVFRSESLPQEWLVKISGQIRFWQSTLQRPFRAKFWYFPPRQS